MALINREEEIPRPERPKTLMEQLRARHRARLGQPEPQPQPGPQPGQMAGGWDQRHRRHFGEVKPLVGREPVVEREVLPVHSKTGLRRYRAR